MTQDDGGPAFPSDLVIGNAVTARKPYDGMSLRDYFAGQALAGLVSTMEGDHPFYEMSTRNMAKLSYNYADAMLEARK